MEQNLDLGQTKLARNQTSGDRREDERGGKFCTGEKIVGLLSILVELLMQRKFRPKTFNPTVKT